MSEENSVSIVSSEINIAEQDESIITPTIVLSTYEDCNDEKVLKNVKEVFKGFCYDPNEEIETRFDTNDQVVNYVVQSLSDIRKVSKNTEVWTLCNKAAATARLWYTCASIHKAIANGKYGTSISNQIASELQVSVSRVYQLKEIARKLTATDCYLLGMRDCGITILKDLAMIKDDTVRKNIISTFINSYVDSSSYAENKMAKSMLTSAIKMALSSNFEEISTTDPTTYENTQVDTTEALPEPYLKTNDALTKIASAINKISKEKNIDNWTNTLADFYIKEDTANAAVLLDNIKDRASCIKEMVVKAIEGLNSILSELTSLEHVEVLKDEYEDAIEED